MKSPFPGMDPFVEARGLWSDFRIQLICGIERVLNATMPTGYAARLGHRCYVNQPLDDLAPENEDLTWSRDDFVPLPPPVPTGMSSGEYAMHPGPPERTCREAYIHIYRHDKTGEFKVPVTCIELLSPENKRRGWRGWRIYQEKRDILLGCAANFLEIDLLRIGQRRQMREPWPDSPYYVLVSRKTQPLTCQVFPGFATQHLPTFPVPLDAEVVEVPVHLQSIVDDVLAHSRYESRMKYRDPIDPPLSPDEADVLLRAL